MEGIPVGRVDEWQLTVDFGFGGDSDSPRGSVDEDVYFWKCGNWGNGKWEMKRDGMNTS